MTWIYFLKSIQTKLPSNTTSIIPIRFNVFRCHIAIMTSGERLTVYLIVNVDYVKRLICNNVLWMACITARRAKMIRIHTAHVCNIRLKFYRIYTFNTSITTLLFNIFLFYFQHILFRHEIWIYFIKFIRTCY